MKSQYILIKKTDVFVYLYFIMAIVGGSSLNDFVTLNAAGNRFLILVFASCALYFLWVFTGKEDFEGDEPLRIIADQRRFANMQRLKRSLLGQVLGSSDWLAVASGFLAFFVTAATVCGIMYWLKFIS